MIDADGYGYKAQAICDALRPPRIIDLNCYKRVSPGTQVDVVLLFPEVNRSTQVARLSYGKHRERERYQFEINKSKRGASDLDQARLRTDPWSSRIEECQSYLGQLKEVVQSSLSETHTRIESESLDRKIKTLLQTIEQALRRIKSVDRKPLETVFQSLMADYQQGIENDKKRAEQKKRGKQTLDQLLRLSPTEFEKAVGEVLEAHGYEKVRVRGGSGDQGADILAEKMNERVAIQCKRLKGMVGPSGVRELMGALELTECHRGLLVTTGMFSIEAQRMVRETSIELISGDKLIELISEAIAK
ncbi:MAG: restriction endonuclease [Pyrinomonadaceae bacterium]